MSKITLDNLSDNLKQYLNGLGLTESQVQQLINRLKEEEIGDINNLQTNNKTLVAAINELFQNANNGKELIASAIGEPLDSSDTFQAMSNDLNGLLGTFKTNMMKNGVTVGSGDKFKALIDKIATLSDSEGKGLQYTTGFINRTSNLISETSDSTTRINLTFDQPLDFTPTRLILSIPVLGLSKDIAGNYYMHDVSIDSMFCDNTNGYCEVHDDNINAYVLMYIKNISSTGFTLYAEKSTTNYPLACPNGIYWVALGVEGEEDTTLRDSLANILGDKGVEVSPEDDMATLIGKVDGISGGLDIISATELPSTGKQNQICVITDNPVNSFLLSSYESDISALDSSTIGIYLNDDATVYDSTKIALSSNNITVNYYINSVSQGDTRLASYIYNNSKWNSLTYKSYPVIENRKLITSYVGNFASDVIIDSEYNGFEISNSSSSSSYRYSIISASKKINFDNISKAEFEIRSNRSTTNVDFYIGVTQAEQLNQAYNAGGTLDMCSSYNSINFTHSDFKKYTMDLSNVTGSGYLALVMYCTSLSTTIYIPNLILY